MKCRHCNHSLSLPFVDLGSMPPSNAYLSCESDFEKEVSFPLNILVCDKCWLVQTEDFTRADELFTDDYAYLSSTSSTWVEHARLFVDELVESQNLDAESFVVELAANDGYLLQHVVRKGIPCLGIEPTSVAAEIARSKGVDIQECFFGLEQAYRLLNDYPKANAIIGNNVLAHVPDINDFVSGIATMLAKTGVVSLEFPHLLNLIKYKQFDTIYHEHFSYLSLTAVSNILASAGLEVFNVEKLSTHGGSLRVWAQHSGQIKKVNHNVLNVLEEEQHFGMGLHNTYQNFAHSVDAISQDLKAFLKKAKASHKTIVAYGAAAKGNTLLNYAGVDVSDIPVVFDAADSKQGKFMPASHIPILPPSGLKEYSPDYVLILPWNIAHEIKDVVKPLVPKTCKFITAIPELRVI
ncbi:class I SAM-dependent methyltransferase [Alteromonas gracilis]|uniref:SAM-dependent methyltransferase n=1 Tax=Alteromonas gracilis TaxID=1479524 RepID=A0ABX5CQW2_9ALTE|nr:class I SAM-dependent methyltransferase [Alteromonas gracilis]PRO69984.1 SAM-dependent methyltransferase [Alteromonas gracilis]